MQAELARVEGRPFEAAELYDEAIEAAGPAGVPAGRGAGQRAVRALSPGPGAQALRRPLPGPGARGLPALGRAGQGRGAGGGVPRAAARPGTARPGAASRTGDDARGAALDLLTLFRAAEAIAGRGGAEPPAGQADGGLPGHRRGRARRARARGGAGSPSCARWAPSPTGSPCTREPALSARHLPGRRDRAGARRTGETVVLADASAHEELGQDPYVAGPRRALGAGHPHRAPGQAGGRAVPGEQPGHPGVHRRAGAAAAAPVGPDRHRPREQPAVRGADPRDRGAQAGRDGGRLPGRVGRRPQRVARLRAHAGQGGPPGRLLPGRLVHRRPGRARARCSGWRCAHRDPAQEERLRELRHLQRRGGGRARPRPRSSRPARPVLFTRRLRGDAGPLRRPTPRPPDAGAGDRRRAAA